MIKEIQDPCVDILNQVSQLVLAGKKEEAIKLLEDTIGTLYTLTDHFEDQISRVSKVPGGGVPAIPSISELVRAQNPDLGELLLNPIADKPNNVFKRIKNYLNKEVT
jgi:hypothetical protein